MIPLNPGSREALAEGCRCPIMDNNHGKYPPRPPDGWFISLDCPLHNGPPHDERNDDDA